MLENFSASAKQTQSVAETIQTVKQQISYFREDFSGKLDNLLGIIYTLHQINSIGTGIGQNTLPQQPGLYSQSPADQLINLQESTVKVQSRAGGNILPIPSRCYEHENGHFITKSMDSSSLDKRGLLPKDQITTRKNINIGTRGDYSSDPHKATKRCIDTKYQEGAGSASRSMHHGTGCANMDGTAMGLPCNPPGSLSSVKKMNPKASKLLKIDETFPLERAFSPALHQGIDQPQYETLIADFDDKQRQNYEFLFDGMVDRSPRGFIALDQLKEVGEGYDSPFLLGDY